MARAHLLVQLLERMRAAKNETPVINFLEKPLNTDAMLIAIETALRLTRDETEASSLRRAAGLAADFLGDSAPVRHLVDANRKGRQKRSDGLGDGRARHRERARGARHPPPQPAAAARALDLERSHLYKKARALGLRGEKGDGEA
jgi:DNA-binding NtrC family response regulator